MNYTGDSDHHLTFQHTNKMAYTPLSALWYRGWFHTQEISWFCLLTFIPSISPNLWPSHNITTQTAFDQCVIIFINPTLIWEFSDSTCHVFSTDLRHLRDNLIVNLLVEMHQWGHLILCSPVRVPRRALYCICPHERHTKRHFIWCKGSLESTLSHHCEHRSPLD